MKQIRYVEKYWKCRRGLVNTPSASESQTRRSTYLQLNRAGISPDGRATFLDGRRRGDVVFGAAERRARTRTAGPLVSRVHRARRAAHSRVVPVDVGQRRRRTRRRRRQRRRWRWRRRRRRRHQRPVELGRVVRCGRPFSTQTGMLLLLLLLLSVVQTRRLLAVSRLFGGRVQRRRRRRCEYSPANGRRARVAGVFVVARRPILLVLREKRRRRLAGHLSRAHCRRARRLCVAVGRPPLRPNHSSRRHTAKNATHRSNTSPNVVNVIFFLDTFNTCSSSLSFDKSCSVFTTSESIQYG